MPRILQQYHKSLYLDRPPKAADYSWETAIIRSTQIIGTAFDVEQNTVPIVLVQLESRFLCQVLPESGAADAISTTTTEASAHKNTWARIRKARLASPSRSGSANAA